MNLYNRYTYPIKHPMGTFTVIVCYNMFVVYIPRFYPRFYELRILIRETSYQASSHTTLYLISTWAIASPCWSGAHRPLPSESCVPRSHPHAYQSASVTGCPPLAPRAGSACPLASAAPPAASNMIFRSHIDYI